MLSLANSTRFILSLFGVYSILGSFILNYSFPLAIYDMIEMFTFIIFSVIIGGSFSFITMMLLVIYRHHKYFH